MAAITRFGWDGAFAGRYGSFAGKAEAVSFEGLVCASISLYPAILGTPGVVPAVVGSLGISPGVLGSVEIRVC